MKRNQTIIQFFEWYTPADGKHWNRFSERIKQFQTLGITAAWLPPAYKGTRGAESEGYDVYDIYDLGEFDQKGSVRTKYGTKEEYITAVNAARAAGIRVYIDIVLNHMGGAEEKEKMMVRAVDTDDRTIFNGETREIEAYTRFTFPGRNGKHSTFQWNKEHFTGIDHEAGSTETSIFKIINEFGEDWKPLVHTEKGNFDYLILNDIETRHPAVREELRNWIKWYHDTLPFDGVRIDAVKHVDPAFFNEWLDFIRQTVNPETDAIGEYWLSDDLPVLLKYIEATNARMKLFDAPLHHNFATAAAQREDYDLRDILKVSLLQERPELAVTFVDNHDTQPLQSLEEFTEQWFKPHAYSLILLRAEGHPCVFYPDLYGTCYSGKRSTGEECTINIPPLEVLPALLQLRKDFAYGKQTDQFDAADSIAWVREGVDELPQSGCIVLLSINRFEPVTKLVYAGPAFAGKTIYDCLDNDKPATVSDDGYVLLTVEAATIGVWTRKPMSTAFSAQD